MKSYSKFSLIRKNSLPLYSDFFLCNFRSNFSIEKVVGKKIFVYGESNTGKTELTSKFLSILRKNPKVQSIFVFDLAPERFRRNSINLGGKLIEHESKYVEDSKIQTYSFPIIPPRSSSNNMCEVYENCAKNFTMIYNDFTRVIEEILSHKGESALIINDFSIFLHLGSYFPLLSILKTNHSVVVNAYYGDEIAFDFDSYISSREKLLVERLVRRFDYSIHLVK